MFVKKYFSKAYACIEKISRRRDVPKCDMDGKIRSNLKGFFGLTIFSNSLKINFFLTSVIKVTRGDQKHLEYQAKWTKR